MPKIIKLSQNKETIVDDEDYEELIKFSWYYGSNGYVRRQTARPNRKTITIHRQLMKFPENMIVDHINGDPLDNRKENLRICTVKENQRNKRKRKMTASKYKGPSREGKKWKSAIEVDNKSIHLGMFFTDKEAAVAYNKAAIKYFGAFASLNIIEDEDDC